MRLLGSMVASSFCTRLSIVFKFTGSPTSEHLVLPGISLVCKLPQSFAFDVCWWFFFRQLGNNAVAIPHYIYPLWFGLLGWCCEQECLYWLFWSQQLQSNASRHHLYSPHLTQVMLWESIANHIFSSSVFSWANTLSQAMTPLLTWWLLQPTRTKWFSLKPC